ncbi:MAG: VCBS repeat-containing protein [Phycisphaerales bacterium]|nr:VCBS repeat-containing protein [Phycisphaerales bacterium]
MPRTHQLILIENLGHDGSGWLGFGPITSFSVDAGPADVEVGDLNGDNRPDVIVASEGGNSISVVMNLGLLNFDQPVAIPVSESPRSLTLVDIEDDGDLDAAMIITEPFLGQRVVSVLRNDFDPQSGQLAFVQTEPLGIGTDPLLVLSSNVDGLVGDDLVTINDESSVRGIADEDDVSVYLNTNGTCIGDTNGDDTVNFADLNLLLDNWARTTAPGTEGDINGDGIVNFADLNLLLDRWGQICP